VFFNWFGFWLVWLKAPGDRGFFNVHFHALPVPAGYSILKEVLQPEYPDLITS